MTLLKTSVFVKSTNEWQLEEHTTGEEKTKKKLLNKGNPLWGKDG
jgi:hypothetical protein